MVDVDVLTRSEPFAEESSELIAHAICPHEDPLHLTEALLVGLLLCFLTQGDQFHVCLHLSS